MTFVQIELVLILSRLATVFFWHWGDLFKWRSRMEDLLRFPSYYTILSNYDEMLCFGWFPSNSCYNNGDVDHVILNNVDYLEI